MLDVALANTGAQPLWFVLPLILETPGALGPLFASAVEVMELPGPGRVRIARFLGPGSFQLLRLAPGVRVRVTGLPVTLTGARPRDSLTIPMLAAQELHLEDRLIEQWLGIDLTIASDADAVFEDGGIVASQDTEGVRALPVRASGVQSMARVLTLGGS
ncbi:hypothetical protein ACQ86G_21585 [Roseateles chitinivorans]|uniref:hypothetical protein n=1 Tax=Roseateles chitinivorans TaxID=2917965 RepID=UPI003D679514